MGTRKYRRDKSYEWNYENSPEAVGSSSTTFEAPSPCGSWEFLGLPVESPIGVAAGPLLNGKWVQYYASLGFSVLTYKTVRSTYRECYPVPNLTHVSCGQLDGSETTLPESSAQTDTWAVSFGMPSKEPDAWRADIESTRRQLPERSVLSVSVVGTMQPKWTIEDLADDYAICAKWAVDSGADCIETNFSCPNVSSCDGQLYQNSADAAVIAEKVRSVIGRTPFVIKIGHFHDTDTAAELLHAVSKHANAIVTTNSIATTVMGNEGQLLFDGKPRGICGDAIRRESIRQTDALRQIIDKHELPLKIVGVGGINRAEHVRDYLDAGAESVQVATAAMLDPLVGIKIRKALARD